MRPKYTLPHPFLFIQFQSFCIKFQFFISENIIFRCNLNTIAVYVSIDPVKHKLNRIQLTLNKAISQIR